MPSAGCLGLDIGGANLKAASLEGFALEVAFPLWRRPNELGAQIGWLLESAPPFEGLAVTMTGELADCYGSKAEGVAAIVAAVDEAAEEVAPAHYYTLDGGFLDSAAAAVEWRRVAAANWHALASAAVARRFGDGVLVDVGSTTTDIVVVSDGRVDGGGEADTERLMAGGLLYQGVGRTPVCAVVDALPYRGGECPVAAEVFATTADAAVLLGHPTVVNTADGRPPTKPFAAARLGRMLCADTEEFSHTDAVVAAEAVVEEMSRRLATGLERSAANALVRDGPVVLSGSGAWLARRTLAAMEHAGTVLDLAELVGAGVSRCGPAWAVAALLDEQQESRGNPRT